MLRAIEEVIGQVLKIDYNTEGFDKARFARMAVKLDLTKPLVSKIKLDGLTQLVEYEGLPTICYSCGRYGHLDVTCPSKSQHSCPSTIAANSQASTQVPVKQEREPQMRDEQLFDDWMQVRLCNGRPPKAARREDQEPFHSDVRGNNRFNMLASLSSSVEHQNGKPCLEKEERHMSATGRGTKGNDNMKGGKAKSTTTGQAMSTTSKDKAQVAVIGIPRTKAHEATSHSIFNSPAYKEMYQHTTLSDRHSAVVLSVPEGEASQQPFAVGPPPSWSIGLDRAKRLDFPPKPPNGARPKKGLHVSTHARFKVSRPKSKELLGSPSEKLTEALSAVLGQNLESDDDTAFDEAAKALFEVDSVSDHSERETLY